MLKGVLFDLGDTLQEFAVENWDDIVMAHNRELYRYLATTGHAHRIPPLDEFLELVNTTVQEGRAEAASTMRALALSEVLENLFQRHGIDDLQVGECIAPWYRPMTEHLIVQPDVEPTLRALIDGGLRLGLVSNTGWPSSAHDADLERFGIRDLLECRIYSCEVGWEKPAPQIFNAALECMDLRPEETAFVGDFLRYDVAGARSVGMKGIWKRMTNRPDSADDHTIVPDAVITRIGELPRVLEELYGWKA